MIKHLLSASAMILILLSSACGGSKPANGVDSGAIADSVAATQMADSIAEADSLSSADSVRVTNAIAKGNLEELLREYDRQCVAVYDEYGSDGMPLGEQPPVLQRALALRAKLVPMEGRMSNSQKELYDSVTGYIRRFLYQNQLGVRHITHWCQWLIPTQLMFLGF